MAHADRQNDLYVLTITSSRVWLWGRWLQLKRGLSRRPCWWQTTVKTIYIKTKFIFQRRNISLFCISNTASVKTLIGSAILKKLCCCVGGKVKYKTFGFINWVDNVNWPPSISRLYNLVPRVLSLPPSREKERGPWERDCRLYGHRGQSTLSTQLINPKFCHVQALLLIERLWMDTQGGLNCSSNDRFSIACIKSRFRFVRAE